MIRCLYPNLDKPFQVNLFKEQTKFLEEECFKKGLKRNELMRAIVNYYIEKKGGKTE